VAHGTAEGEGAVRFMWSRPLCCTVYRREWLMITGDERPAATDYGSTVSYYCTEYRPAALPFISVMMMMCDVQS
jgi:hypothetical protein